MKFAKLFDVSETHQMLYTQKENEDDQEYELVIRCDNEGVSCEMSIGFTNVDAMKEAFEKTNQESADKMYKKIIEQFVG